MDIERIESSMKKFLSDNCVDTNATVLQNIRTFLDHVSNVFKDMVVLYETRNDIERMSPDSVDPNAFSNMVTRLQKEYNDNHPGWQTVGGDVRMGRFEYIPDKVVPCGLLARRHHGTKNGPPNGHGPPGAEETCHGMWHNAHQSAFWQAHVAHPQLAEFKDFDDAVDAVTPPQAVAISVLLDREKAGTYSGFEIPTEKTLRKIGLIMGTDFREFCRTSRLQKPALKCQAEMDAVKPRQCRNFFRTLVGIYTAAYKQDNFAVVDKVIKQFDEQIIMSPDKSFLLFCQSLQGCQTAIDKMTRRNDLRIGDDAVLRKYLRGLAVVGHKPPTECDSMDTEYRDLYRDYNKYQESADPAAHVHHSKFSTKDALYAEILAIHTRWSLSCPRGKTAPANWIAMTPGLMEPIVTAGGRLHVLSDELLFSLTSMNDHIFENVLSICDGDGSVVDDTSGMQPYCDAILSLDTFGLDELYMARDQRSAPYNNAFGVGGGRGGGRNGGRARGRGGFGGGRGAFGRGSGGPPPKGRNAPYGSYLTSYRKDDNRNSGFNAMSGQYDPNKTNAPERRQATIDKVHNDLRINRERGKIEGARDRAANTETRRFGSTTMLAPAPKKAGQQIFSNVRLGKSLAQRGIDNPVEAPQLCSRIVKILDQLYVHECSSSEPASGVVLAIDDEQSVDVSKEFLHDAMSKLDDSLSDDQKLAFLEIAGNIKGGHIMMMTVEFDAVANDFCTEHMPSDAHEHLCLTTQNTHKQKCKIFDTGASQNVEQDRSMFIVYFELKVPIPMKQGEGVLYATGMGIVIYNFRRDDESAYSEPGFALHTPKANAGMSIISKSSFQDVGFGYMAPPFVNTPGSTLSTDFWFPRTWFPNFVPMVLDQAPDDMRFIKMYSNNNSNLSLVPVFSEDEIVDKGFKRYSFTSAELYDERTQITVLLDKMVNDDDGRYAKYHPNVMLALFASHCMMDVPVRQSSQGSGEGLEESKSEECNVVASCKPTPAELDMIRSGAVTSEQLR